VAFVLSVIVGPRRFAHANQLRADRALHALLGMKRFPSDDTILNYIRRFNSASSVTLRLETPAWTGPKALLCLGLAPREAEVLYWIYERPT
jgi:hypothetical protein